MQNGPNVDPAEISKFDAAAPRWWDEIVPGLTQLTPDEVVARYAAKGDPFA